MFDQAAPVSVTRASVSVESVAFVDCRHRVELVALAIVTEARVVYIPTSDTPRLDCPSSDRKLTI